MPATPTSTAGRLAGNYLKLAANVIGGANNHFYIATQNDQYIIALRDEVVASGKPVDDPLVVGCNEAHYASSDAIELFGNLNYVRGLPAQGDKVIAAADYLDALP